MLSPSTIPRGLGPPRTSGARHSGQVFGLVGTTGRSPEPGPDPISYWPSLPRTRVASQCFMTAVVPTHRCGAVPDSHRVPCCHDPPGGWAVPAAALTISSTSTSTKHLHVASACCRVPLVRGVRGYLGSSRVAGGRVHGRLPRL